MTMRSISMMTQNHLRMPEMHDTVSLVSLETCKYTDHFCCYHYCLFRAHQSMGVQKMST